MRVKLSEILLGELLVGVGALEIGAGKAGVYGYPQPLWTAYLLVAVGVALPLVAWMLRSPTRNKQK
jgi:predicted acyltransferase